MNWQLVESDADLHALLSRAAGSDAVIMDTEFMRRSTFYPQVALLQLCFTGNDNGMDEETAWLIDPLALQDTSPLVELLVDPGVVKVLHSPSEDLEVLNHWLGVLPQPLFDTQRAAALVGHDFGLGYRALVQAICDVDLPKGETRSNWLQRPLTRSQCDYAAQDVCYLLLVWRHLQAQCQRLGRQRWAEEEGRYALAKAAAGQTEEYYLRIKSAWKLNRRQLAALRAVCRWREQTARRRDKPRGWILDDKACLQLALTRADNVDELQAVADLPPAVVRRHGDDLLAIVTQHRDAPETELPETLPPPPDARERDRIKKMKAHVRALAQDLGVQPELLMSGKDYEFMLYQSTGDTVAWPPHWRGWREQAVVQPLQALLLAGSL